VEECIRVLCEGEGDRKGGDGWGAGWGGGGMREVRALAGLDFA
jgi:hypothetical protein